MTHTDTVDREKSPRGLLARGAAGIAALAAGAAVALGITVALFSATQTSSSNTFTAGTVSVGLGSESVTCQIAQIMPGDSSVGHPSGSKDLSTCVYDVRYTGNAPAWLAVDILVQGGTPSLYTGSSTGFQVLLTANDTLTLVNGTSYLAQNGSSTSLSSGVTAGDLLLSTTPAEQGDAIRFDVDYLLPTLAPNALQGGEVSVTLTFHAVQSDNQPVGTCVAGRQCGGIVWG